MVSVIQWGTTASSHETHGANHGLSTRDACIETERETRLDKPQCYLSMPNRNQIPSFANPCNDNGCHTLGRVLYVKTSELQGTDTFCKENISPSHLLSHCSTELTTYYHTAEKGIFRTADPNCPPKLKKKFSN